MSAVVSLVVAALGGWFALTSTQLGANEDRAKESREKRSLIYADYLTTARTYLSAKDTAAKAKAVADVAQRDVPNRVTANMPASKIANLQRHADSLSGAYSASLSRTTTAWIAYKKQVDLVYVYGSDNAWQAHLAIGRAIGAEPGSDGFEQFVSATALVAALGNFQTVFCQEASAMPRKGCG